jgi:hypothetical protein
MDSNEIPSWVLVLPAVKVPDEAIVRDDKGVPIVNPEGEAVVCHDTEWKQNGEFSVPDATIWCVVLPAGA